MPSSVLKPYKYLVPTPHFEVLFVMAMSKWYSTLTQTSNELSSALSKVRFSWWDFGGLPVDNAGGSSDILLRCVLKALDF